MRILRALPGICFFSLPMLGARRECQGRVRRMVPRRCMMVFNGDTGKVLNARSGEAAQEAMLELRPFTAKGNHRPNHTRNLPAGRLRARMKYSIKRRLGRLELLKLNSVIVWTHGHRN